MVTASSNKEWNKLFRFARQLLESNGKEVTAKALVEQLSVEGINEFQPIVALDEEMWRLVFRFRKLNQLVRLTKARTYLEREKSYGR